MFPCFFGILCGNAGDHLVHNPTVQEAPIQQHDLVTISLVPEDVMSRHVLSFLTLSEVVRLDSALANHKLRSFLHVCLEGILLCGTVDFRYLDWCRGRKCSARTLQITSAVNNGSHIVHATRFEVLEVHATEQISKEMLSKLLTDGKDFKVLDVQFFCTMRVHHLLPLDVDLPLVEIDVTGNKRLYDDALVVLVSRCPLLRVIRAARCFAVTKALPLALAAHCPQLRVASLLTRGGHGDAPVEQQSSGYNELLQSCRQLQVVDCKGDFSIANMQTLAECFSGLTSVTLQVRYHHEWNEEHTARADAALSTLAQNNPHIHTLKLFNFQQFSDASLLAVAQNLPNLHTFSLDDCQASLPGLSAIRANCTSLTTFEVYNYRFLATFHNPVHFPYLQLSIITTLDINTSTLSDAQLVETTQANPHIRALIIRSEGLTQSPTLVLSSALCDALSHLHNLEVFDLGTIMYENYCNRFLLRVDDTVLYALSTLSELRSLNGSQCANLADSGITAIAQGCPLLTDFYLSQCSHNINNSVSILARNGRNLTKVRLEACKTIRDSDIQNLIRHARYLQTLNITQNPNLTFMAVAELPEYCLNMRLLRLYGAPLVTPRKPLVVESYEAYRNHRYYFDVIFGWLEELLVRG